MIAPDADGLSIAPKLGAPSTAIITLSSAERLAHLRNQFAAVDAGALRVVAWVGDDTPPALAAHVVVSVPPGPEGVRLAAARNAGAAAALASGADLLVFLDADCIPGPDLLRRYTGASGRHPDAVLCGPVTYLPARAAVDPAALAAATSPHPARPMPPDDAETVADADEYRLFWSLSYALTASTWRRSGGFDERYEGYGGEDTDFAFRLRRAGIPLAWVGGAHAYHQYHPTSSPPWQHIDDILRNGRLFAETWGEWPMIGWLEQFESGGAVVREDGGWRRSG